MTWRSSAIAIVLSICVATTLTACTSGGLVVPPSSTHISACPPRATPYAVTNIGKTVHARCDIAGELLIFPDGYEVRAPTQGLNESVGGASQYGPKKNLPNPNTYSLINLGTYGVVVGEWDVATGKSLWWGTKRGLNLYWAAFGTKAPNSNG